MLCVRGYLCQSTRGLTTRKMNILKRIKDGVPNLCKINGNLNETGQKLHQFYQRNVNTIQHRRFHMQCVYFNEAVIKSVESVKICNSIQNKSDEFGIDNVVNSYIKPIQTKNDNQNSDFTSSPEFIQDQVPKWLFSDIITLPNENIKLLFPNPKHHLDNIYKMVGKELDVKEPLIASHKATFSNAKQTWLATYKVVWPEEIQFTAKANSKAEASGAVALKILYWLDSHNLLRNRKPVFYDHKQVKSMTNKPGEMNIDIPVLEKVNNFLNKYEDEFQKINLELKSSNDANEDTISTQDEAARISEIKKKLFPHAEDLYLRNDHIHRQFLLRQDIEKANMPIFDFRNLILELLEKSQALVIKGDTGCGKTTQVPQFIMDYFTKQQKSCECNMIVTEPRRISAISLAERVAYERGENVGDVVGYQVRHNHVLPKYPGSILFCTTGILLKRLQNNPHLHGYSHVVVDEAHERSVELDMLLVLLKRAILCNSTLKVIVMSATINAELFQDFLDCPAVDVPGMLHPVKMHFAEDIEKLGIVASSDSLEVEEHEEIQNVFTNCEEITKVIQYIDESKPPGAVLCFLPGWNEISQVQSLLEESPCHNLLIVPIHSKLPHMGQSKIFDPPPQGYRKIILATDIAETGITVPDVVYVVDSALHKESIWNKAKGVSSIKTQWVSQANINQRRGRAGRVQPGESYHFISQNKYKSLSTYPKPEIMRISLEKAVLDAKLFSNEDAADFFGSMPQPPSRSSLAMAVSNLRELGAFDLEENLTSLGKRIASFSLHPKLAKAMVYSTIFECVDPVVTITSALSLEAELFKGTLGNKVHVRKTKTIFQPTSDHLALYWIYKQWESFFMKGPKVGMTFCRQNNINHTRIITLQKIREINAKHLHESGMLKEGSMWYSSQATVNEFSELEELVRGVLLSGIDQILKIRDFEVRNGRVTKTGNSAVTEDGAKAQLTPESVNYKRKSWPSSFMVYYQKTHHEERRMTLIRESSLISPVTTILFSQKEIRCLKYFDENGNYIRDKALLKIVDNNNVSLICDRETAFIILRFRDLMWSMVNYHIEKLPIDNDVNYGLVTKENILPEVTFIKQEMLKCLSQLLSTSSEAIDFCDSQDKTDSQREIDGDSL